MSSLIRRVAKNSIVQTVGFLAKGITGFVVVVAIGRLAGVKSVGDFSFVVTFVLLFTFIAQMGIPDLLVRELARRRDDRQAVTHLVGNAISICALLGPVAIFAMAAVVRSMGYPWPIFYAVVLAGLGLCLHSIVEVIASVFKAYESMEWSSALTVAEELLFLLGAVIVLVVGYSLVWLFVAYLFSRLFALVLAAGLHRRNFGILAFGRELHTWRTLLRLGFPFAANIALSPVYIRLDVVVLSMLSGNLAVGFYEAATSLVIHTNIIALVVNYSLLPVLSREFLRESRRVVTYTAKSIQYIAIPGFLIAILLLVLGDRILILIYGNRFVGSTAAVRLLAVIIPLRLISHSLATTLTATDRQGLRSMGIAVAAASNVGLNLLLIPPYGLMGAVYATILTELTLFICFVWFTGTDRWAMLNFRGLAVPALSALVAGCATLLLRTTNTNLFVVLSSCCALYAGVLWIGDKEIRGVVASLLLRERWRGSPRSAETGRQ